MESFSPRRTLLKVPKSPEKQNLSSKPKQKSGGFAIQEVERANSDAFKTVPEDPNRMQDPNSPMKHRLKLAGQLSKIRVSDHPVKEDTETSQGKTRQESPHGQRGENCSNGESPRREYPDINMRGVNKNVRFRGAGLGSSRAGSETARRSARREWQEGIMRTIINIKILIKREKTHNLGTDLLLMTLQYYQNFDCY